jgi:hypothetical protein
MLASAQADRDRRGLKAAPGGDRRAATIAEAFALCTPSRAIVTPRAIRTAV